MVMARARGERDHSGNTAGAGLGQPGTEDRLARALAHEGSEGLRQSASRGQLGAGRAQAVQLGQLGRTQAFWAALEDQLFAIGWLDHPVGRLAEGLQVITQLWTEPRSTFAGRCYQLRDATATPEGLARRTGTHERYVREWLLNQAAGGYIAYGPAGGRYTLPPEHAAALPGLVGSLDR
jgi:hypothetical protein